MKITAEWSGMKITAEWSGEVGVDISKDDILKTFAISPDAGETWLQIIDRFCWAMNVYTDAEIANLTTGQRHILADFFYKQAARFADSQGAS